MFLGSGCFYKFGGVLLWVHTKRLQHVVIDIMDIMKIGRIHELEGPFSGSPYKKSHTGVYTRARAPDVRQHSSVRVLGASGPKLEGVPKKPMA